MRIAESLVGRFSEGIKTVARGYSLKDVANAQRIVAGHIAPEDREAYKQGQKRYFSQIYFQPPIQRHSLGDSPVVELYSSGAIQEYQKAVLETDSLPNEEIDQHLIETHRQKLKKWGYPFPQ